MKNQLRNGLLAILVFFAAGVKAQVPQLSSLPGASTTIFLDFDGHYVTGTTWNYNGPIDCGPATLTSAQITEIFNRVAEDYRPFSINVTTDSTQFLATPLNRRMRAILTVSSSWYGSAGGVAYVNSFSWSDDTPCFIFTQLLNNNVKNISEAAAHEVGHTLGLRHQASYDANCVKTSDYNYGQGSGEIGWAPIMGVGYYQNFTVWHNGPSPLGCTTYQSDLDLITSVNNGITFRQDDHQDLLATATQANFNNNQFNINGVVEKTDDRDLFRFNIPLFGQFRLDAVPYNVGTGNAGSDLDMYIQLLNSAETVIATYNPSNILGLVIDTLLPPGDYYLRIDGKGNQYATEYGSLGSYSLTGSFAAQPLLPLRRLELRGSLNGSKHELKWVIDADEQVVKQSIEASYDGVNFTLLNEQQGNTRMFSYTPNESGTIQYRIKVLFDNGREYFSNTVALKTNTKAARPKIINNPITSDRIVVNSPAVYWYNIVDITGKIISKGKINSGVNNIDANHLPAGMLVIQFYNDDEQFTEKLIKQ